MHKPEFVLENKTHKLLWNFQIQTDHFIQARRLNFVIINKKENLPNSELHSPLWRTTGMKIQENEKTDKYLGLARELKKAMEHML